MKFLNVVGIFFIGAMGGLLASYVTNNVTTTKDANEIELVSPLDSSYHDDKNVYHIHSGIDLTKAALKAVKAVVHVKTITEGETYIINPFEYYFGASPEIARGSNSLSFGSGVIISSDGYIITNNHVIKNSDQIKVALNNGKEYNAKLVGTDPQTDVALLKIDAKNLSILKLGNSDDIELGEWVLAVGNPYNLTSTVTAGIISSKARNFTNEMNFESFIQTDAAVNSGNSGGALVNSKGEMIGMNTAIQSPTGSYTGYSFAVPVNIVKRVVRDLKKYGKVEKPKLGIGIKDVTENLAQYYNLPEKKGILVCQVYNNSPAKKAGIEVGDIIIGVDGKKVMNFAQLNQKLLMKVKGDIINVLINRKGKKHKVDVVLEKF